MLEKFHAFITVVTKVYTLSLSQATWIHSIPSKVFSLTYVLMLSSHVCLVLQTSLFQVFLWKLCMHLFSPLHVPHALPIHLPWFDHPNNIQWAVQIMNLPTMHFPPTSCYFFPLQYKYLPQHHSVANPSSVFFLQIERLYFMPRQNNVQNGSSVYFKFCQLHFRTFSFVTTRNISETACRLNMWSLFESFSF